MRSLIITHSLLACTSSLTCILSERLRSDLPFVTRSYRSSRQKLRRRHIRVANFSTFALTDCESEDGSVNLAGDPFADYSTPGKSSGYFIAQQYDVADDGFPDPQASGLFQEADVERLGLTSTNVTLPSALAMLDPGRYPDMKSSLKASRDGSILVQRFGGSLDISKCKRGRVGDRVFPNDTLYRQERLDIGASEQWHICYASSRSDASLLENLHVVFEDDHMAIVNKPGGVNIFEHSAHTSEKKSMKELLPYALQPPSHGVDNALAMPEAAHRLDKLTSGLLLVAKTRPSLRHLSAQFRSLAIEKTYTAICYSVPKATNMNENAHPIDIVSQNEKEFGEDNWQLIDEPLDGKSAITFWRVLKQFEHKNVELSLLEMKPKTGRYRQLRRHMAKTKGCPLVGDNVFAKGIEKDGVPYHMAKLGLFLCSSAVRFEHPYYKVSECNEFDSNMPSQFSPGGGQVRFHPEGDRVIINASIELPQKFAALHNETQIKPL